MKRDGSNHLFTEIENIRLTYVPASDRSKDADWAGSDVIRIQAYKGAGQALHMGAEMPVKSPTVFVRLIAALCAVYDEGIGEH
jgi:hypothetical protein